MEKKGKGLKIAVVLLSVFVIALSSLCLYLVYKTSNDKTETKKRKTETKEVVSYDTDITNTPLIKVHQKESTSISDNGIIGEANILGASISSVLNGYTKDEDYTKDSQVRYDKYTFNNADYGIGMNQKLVLCAEKSTNVISKIELYFTIYKFNPLIGHRELEKTTKKITSIYNVEPFYTWNDGTTGYDEIGNFDKMKSIMWRNQTINAELTFYELGADKSKPLCLILTLAE